MEKLLLSDTVFRTPVRERRLRISISRKREVDLTFKDSLLRKTPGPRVAPSHGICTGLFLDHLSCSLNPRWNKTKIYHNVPVNYLTHYFIRRHTISFFSLVGYNPLTRSVEWSRRDTIYLSRRDHTFRQTKTDGNPHRSCYKTNYRSFTWTINL